MRNGSQKGQSATLSSDGMSSEFLNEASNEKCDQYANRKDDMSCLVGKRMAVVLFSNFPGDPRPRRAAEAFAQAGMAVEVLCLMDEGSANRETFNGIEIERVAIKKVRNSKLWYLVQYGLFLLSAFVKLTLRSGCKRYDIVHVHNMPDILVFAALIPKLLGSKVLLDLHDPMPELMRTIFGFAPDSPAVKWMTRFERWSISFSDSVITVNRACEKLFASRSCKLEKVSVIMNAPDEKIFRYVPVRQRRQEFVKTGNSFVIMYHGTIVERNGLDLAVDALEKVLEVIPAAELRVYGHRTPFLDQVMDSLPKRKLERAVQYCGPRRLEELVHAIRECDVGVIPNRRSIFTEINTPTRIFEYLALGTPVVAPRAPGIEAYFDEESLILFDLGNVEDLAEKLIWVAMHPEEVLDNVNRGQAVYRAHSWEMEQAKLLALAEQLINPEQR